MKKLNGFKKKVAVFISGKGSNLKKIIKFSKSKKSPIKVDLIISNKLDAAGLNFGRKYNIKRKIFRFKNQKIDERKILKYLKKNNISFICLAGFMKILSKNFIKKFKGKIINIHPSLLPQYKGLNTHARVLKNKEKFSGCTVHHVTSKLDAGKIIIQKKVKINKNETPRSLAKKILKQEHILYPKAIKKLLASH